MILFVSLGCMKIDNKQKKTIDNTIASKQFFSKDNYNHHVDSWFSNEASQNIVIAIHGYSDYSSAFKIPAKYLNKFAIDLHAFDLRGFGRNIDNGEWFNPKIHENDIIDFFNYIKVRNSGKKIFILGESMGGALLINTLMKKKIRPDGVILVAPAIWNFSQDNFLKSKFLNFISHFFPNLSIKGSNVVKVKPTNNFVLLKEFSSDPFVVHEKTLESLNGMKKLLDESYENFEQYLKRPLFDTLFLLPLKDEIIPRKPLLQIIQKLSLKDIEETGGLDIAVYKNHYHMILRDIDGAKVTNKIKEWILGSEELRNKNSLKNSLDMILVEPFYHKLD